MGVPVRWVERHGQRQLAKTPAAAAAGRPVQPHCAAEEKGEQARSGIFAAAPQRGSMLDVRPIILEKHNKTSAPRVHEWATHALVSMLRNLCSAMT